ncbi:hypothetical protein [Aggregatilinea lenta]|uniref:hypothetical protein n=1 Tax=Aggregatilinea lenta TaxID=913108 RepID=UPI0013C3445B|nr:hypothetical protein [Aggregatilinea lenta]
MSNYLQETIDSLDELWLQQHLNHFDYTRTVVERLGSMEQVIALLKAVLKDAVQLEKVAAASYIHDNGFDKIVLVSSAAVPYKLRLHIWWPESRNRVSENIHNHRWDFSSTILTGYFTFQEFHISNRGIPMFEYRYSSPQGGTHYEMNYVGETELTCDFDALLPAKTLYTLSHEVLHRVINDGNQLTSTFMVQGPTEKEFTRVFSAQPVTDSKQVRVKRFTPHELQRRLNRYIEYLNHSASSE